MKKITRGLRGGKLVQRSWQDSDGKSRSRSVPSDCDLQRPKAEGSGWVSAERRRSSPETDVVRKNKRHTVEIQVTHVGSDLQFQSAEVNGTSAEEKQRA